MKTKIYKYCLYITATLAASGLMAQSSKDSPVPYKEIQKKWAPDNFTIREIKKKELQIAPSNVVLLNNAPEIRGKEKSTKKKKGS
jgi:hypothetical protein